MADIQAVVFDLYGTLIYLADETKPYARLFRDIGLQLVEEFRQARIIALTEDFDNLTGLVSRINPNAHTDVQAYETEVQKELSSAMLYPETRSVLEELKKKDMRLGLISNLASPYKKPFARLGLDEYFDEVLFSCEAGLKKPNPKIYQKMLDSLGIGPSLALMTGDKTHTDVYGPKSIGMQAIRLDRDNHSSDNINTLEGIFHYL